MIALAVGVVWLGEQRPGAAVYIGVAALLAVFGHRVGEVDLAADGGAGAAGVISMPRLTPDTIFVFVTLNGGAANPLSQHWPFAATNVQARQSTLAMHEVSQVVWLKDCSGMPGRSPPGLSVLFSCDLRKPEMQLRQFAGLRRAALEPAVAVVDGERVGHAGHPAAALGLAGLRGVSRQRHPGRGSSRAGRRCPGWTAGLR